MTLQLTDDKVAKLRAHLAAIDDILAGTAAPAPVTKPVTPAPTVQGLAPQYGWLANLGDGTPLIIVEALKEVGVKEVAGGASSPVIMTWAREVGLQAVYTGDEIPWCGLFAAVIVQRARKPVVKDPLWARNWAAFGVATKAPGLGDVLVYERAGGGGHVNFYVGEDETAFHGIGGNQSDGVNIMRLEKSRLLAARRPNYANKPEAVKPYRLAAAGALSKNEA